MQHQGPSETTSRCKLDTAKAYAAGYSPKAEAAAGPDTAMANAAGYSPNAADMAGPHQQPHHQVFRFAHHLRH